MENFLHMLNIFVVLIFIIGYLPQIYTTLKYKTNRGVSTSFWFYIAAATSITLRNIIETGGAEWYMYMGQIVNTSFACMFFLYFNHVHNKNNKAKYVLFVLAYLVALPFITNNVEISHSQALASLAIILAYLSQLKHFYTVKTSEGTNPLLYGLFAVGLLDLILLLLLTGASPHTVITESVNVVLLLICYIVAVYYRPKK
ncbi:TPA: hypothetical protein R1960_001833 [Staphylococcus delphini]|nr:hypothetical protein [Staphylococcus delphini]